MTMGAKSRPAPFGGRSAARLGVVQALYQMDIAGTDMADVLAEFGAHRLGEDFDGGQCGPADFEFFKSLLTGVVRAQRSIDPVLNESLAKGWTLARLDSTLRAILRAAAYELHDWPDIPVKVVINEYVEIARAFFSGDEPGFVNGVLDRLGQRFRANEMVRR